MKKLWSVIIPNFNNGKYLDELLSPFLELSEENKSKMEVIVSDDKSTDNSLEVIQKYIDIDSNMYKVYKAEKNSHHGGALNNGMSIATGEWFTFLDGDDKYNVNGMNKTIEALENADDKVDSFTVDVHMFFETTKNDIYEYIQGNDHNKFTLYHNTFPIHCHIVRTRICKDMKIPTGVAYDDYYSTSYIISKIKNVQNRRDIDLFDYRFNRPGQSVGGLLTNCTEIAQNSMFLFDKFRKEVDNEYSFLIPNVLYFVHSIRNLGATTEIINDPKRLYILLCANVENIYEIDYMEFCEWFSPKWNRWVNPLLEKSKDLITMGEEYIEL